MRIFHLTLLPMLIMAVLTAIVGERLARREVEERIPVDRERVLDFAADFQAELERLDELYISHLEHLSAQYFLSGGDDVRGSAEDIVALKSMYLFSEKKMIRSFELLSPSQSAPLPEVSVEGLRPPLVLSRAVIIPAEMVGQTKPGESGWLNAPDEKHLIYWTRPDAEHLVATVVDKDELNRRTAVHLEDWMQDPLTPLRESSTHFAISSPSGEILRAGDEQTRGGAALVMPQRLHSGTWQIQAWDRISQSSHHSAAVLAIALTLAAVFVLSGFLLYQQQRRSLKLARQRVSFVNQVSHELGSPLTNMALNLDLAMDSLGEGEKNTRHRLGLVGQEIDRLNRLVSNVLTFSHCDRGTLEVHRESCLPDEVIARLLDSCRPALTRRGIELEYEPAVNAAVETDPDALTQIVANLVSNVEKYASSGKWLGIKTLLRDEQLVVSVRDRGAGIPEAERTRVFQSFERLENSVNEGSSGAGLGLSIASQLATKLGGTLKMVDCEVGCHFELTLPVNVICAVAGDNKQVI
ncbi:hypothetical protein NT6N_12700 [Oceaniferula spumae]|uniref:histidine kinase n=1 Tax=Oceaniferula spumae TaxID=2979115 RepID=A0AAT9FJR8_9BACT